MLSQQSQLDSPRPVRDIAHTPPETLATAERRARAMAPTVYCPPARIEQCLETNRSGEAR